MEWIKNENKYQVSVESWCAEIEDGTMAQAADLNKKGRIKYVRMDN